MRSAFSRAVAAAPAYFPQPQRRCGLQRARPLERVAARSTTAHPGGRGRGLGSSIGRSTQRPDAQAARPGCGVGHGAQLGTGLGPALSPVESP